MVVLYYRYTKTTSKNSTILFSFVQKYNLRIKIDCTMKRKKSSIRSSNSIKKKKKKRKPIPTIKCARQLIQAFQPIDIVDFSGGRMSKITKNKDQKKHFVGCFSRTFDRLHTCRRIKCASRRVIIVYVQCMVVWIVGLTYTCVRQAARFQVQNSPQQERSVYRSKERRGRPR